MGYFSWLTADTKRSIPCAASSRGARTVYLLQPNAEPPIMESHYEGFGVFGGVNAYEWVARRNLPADVLNKLSSRELLHLGIGLMHGGHLFEDTETGERLTIFSPLPKLFGIKCYPVTYAQPLPDYGGETGNELIAKGRLKPVTLVEVKYPLKFSFKKSAVYEDLPASETDPAQGYFY